MCKDPSQEAVRRGVDDHLKLVMENNPFSLRNITNKPFILGHLEDKPFILKKA